MRSKVSSTYYLGKIFLGFLQNLSLQFKGLLVHRPTSSVCSNKCVKFLECLMLSCITSNLLQIIARIIASWQKERKVFNCYFVHNMFWPWVLLIIRCIKGKNVKSHYLLIISITQCHGELQEYLVS